jgi:hypothetical protein
MINDFPWGGDKLALWSRFLIRQHLYVIVPQSPINKFKLVGEKS